MNTSKKRILIAEDEAAAREILELFLTRAGYDVVLAENGQEGIEALSTQDIDLVITDWMMPHVDGIELIKWIRTECPSELPVIMLTALNSEDARTYALSSGADDFLTKPFRAEEVVASVASHLAEAAKEAWSPSVVEHILVAQRPPFVPVGFLSGGGSPEVLLSLFKSMTEDCQAVFLVHQQGPDWLLEDMAREIKKHTVLKAEQAVEGLELRPGMAVLTGSNAPVQVVSESSHGMQVYKLKTAAQDQGAADLLFESLAMEFGSHVVGVVLSAQGLEGLGGFETLAASNAALLVQDPQEAHCATLPLGAIELKVSPKVFSSKHLPELIRQYLAALSKF